jgi:ATP-dependent RNA helicase DDX3X
MPDTFGTADIKAALPNATDGVDRARAQAHFSAQAQPVNYDNFSAEAETVWDAAATRYEWDGEEGDIGPEFPELELQIFGSAENRIGHGIDFSK